MTESNSQSVPQPVNPDRYKSLVVVLTVITTVITAMVAGLGADANIRASIGNRDSQQYALLAAGELHRQGLQSAYDINVFSGYLTDAQEATIMQLTAGQQGSNSQVAADSLLQSTVDQARADTAQKFSVFYTDSRYAPKTSGGTPDMQAYLTDSTAAAKNLVTKQNAAADDYNRWNHKGDTYTSIMAILAVTLFLFGLAQALSPRLRLLFAVFGVIALAAAGFWTILVLVS